MADDHVRTTDVDGVPVVHLDGEIDLANAAALTERVLRHVPDMAPGIVLDLGGVTYLDSAGVRAFFAVARQLAMREQVFAVTLPEQSPLWRLFKTTRAHEVALLCHTTRAGVDLVTSAASPQPG